MLHNDIKNTKRSNVFRSKVNKSQIKYLNHIVFCEHNPVFTLGKSANEDNLLSSASELKDSSIELFNINRGGDITFHGPGQLTGYLIFDLELFYRDVHKYVRNLEECIIRLLDMYDIKGERLSGFTGVWIKEGKSFRKICAIGVHLSRWVSMHGFGFNVGTDLNYFNQIIPCGIVDANKSVTSLSNELERSIDVSEIQKPLLEIIKEVFNLKYIEL